MRGMFADAALGRIHATGTRFPLSFPEAARWNADRQAVEFGVEIGEYRGRGPGPTARVPTLLPSGPPPRGARTLSHPRALPSRSAAAN
jgi:hypothetical protein